MNDFNKTVLAIVAAAGLAATVYLTRPTPVTDSSFSDQGEIFFAGFTDPRDARALQILSYDESSGAIRPFKVEFDGQRWIIPSHSNYPADAAENMSLASSIFIGLTREQVISDRSADHELLGVLSPDDLTASIKGRGTRITLTGENRAPLADIIIGKQAPDPPGTETPGQRRYVRIPDKNRVYAVNFPKSFSSSFADWVETDLLKLAGQNIARLVVDRYEIDEAQGIKRSTEKLTLSRNAPPDPMNPAPPVAWSMVAEPGGPLLEGEAINSQRIEDALTAFRDLKIVGVRPKPPKLAEWFAGSTDQVTQLELLDLQSRGFFVTNQGQFVANEGEASIVCADGVVYTLYFGEVLFGQGDALSAGVEAIASADPADENQPKGQESRYAFVRITYDESLIPSIPAPPAEVLSTPEDAAPTAESATEPERSPERAEYERQLAERAAKVESGRRRAEVLSKRFADWYYVIDSTSFTKLRPTRADIISADAPSPAEGDTPAVPGIQGASPVLPPPAPGF